MLQHRLTSASSCLYRFASQRSPREDAPSPVATSPPRCRSTPLSHSQSLRHSFRLNATDRTLRSAAPAIPPAPLEATRSTPPLPHSPAAIFASLAIDPFPANAPDGASACESNPAPAPSPSSPAAPPIALRAAAWPIPAPQQTPPENNPPHPRGSEPADRPSSKPPAQTPQRFAANPPSAAPIGLSVPTQSPHPIIFLPPKGRASLPPSHGC